MNKDSLTLYYDNNNELLIDARELYCTLNMRRDFSTWISNKIRSLNLKEDIDFYREYEDKTGLNRKPRIDYKLKIEASNKIIDTLTSNTCNEKIKEFIKSYLPENCESAPVINNNKAIKAPEVITIDSLETFNNESYGRLRTVIINNKVYVVANDVARALGYSNPQKATRTHCKGMFKAAIPTNGGMQSMNVIPEGDIFRLIAKSKLPKAVDFEKWIFEDVLPTINKHGVYATDIAIENMLNNPDYMISLLQKLKEEREEKEKLIIEREETRPMINAYQDFLNSDGLFSFSIAAKILCIPRVPDSNKIIGRNTLLHWLRRDKILAENKEDRNIPYQRFINQGVFKIIPNPEKPERELVKVTPKGLDYLYKKYRYTYMPKRLEDNIPNENNIFEEF